MKFKIPFVINNFEARKYFGLKSALDPLGCDVQYFSVPSNFLGPPPDLPFSVDSLMLAAQSAPSPIDRDVAYVLYAPVEVVRSMVRPGSTTPPVVWLPILKRYAYVLFAPNYLLIFR